MSETVQVPLGDIVFDESVFPRHLIDQVWCDDIAKKIAAGVKFPPLLLDEETNILVDGVHRRMGHIRSGKTLDDLVDVTYQTFNSKADMILESMRINNQHGKRLGEVDRIGAAYKAVQAGAKIDDAARVLEIDPVKLGKAVMSRIASDSDGGIVIRKIGTSAPIGGYYSPGQAKAIRKTSGNPLRSIRILHDLLNHDVLELTPMVVGALIDLRNMIDVKVETDIKEIS